MAQSIYKFGAGCSSTGSKELLGGKGANLAIMAGINIPVPSGFTITTEVCMNYLNATNSKEQAEYIDDLMQEVDDNMVWLRDNFGYMPLVSIRSGARVSMPGMMDTILNAGLTTKTLPFWKEKLGARAALDSYRRLIQMFGEVAMGVPADIFEDLLVSMKLLAEVEHDSDLGEVHLGMLVGNYRAAVKEHTGHHFPDTVEDQLRLGILAVFSSWHNDRAKAYRKMNGYSDDWGTAVNIQSMVFGNLNDESSTGVLFTRCPATGKNVLTGEYLVNAQGEDVVAGIRTPEPLTKMPKWDLKVYDRLFKLSDNLEHHYKDMQDIEFTVQDGELFILQTRNGKRSAEASFKIAYDLWDHGHIDEAEMLKRVTAKEFFVLQQPKIDPSFKEAPALTGIAAGGGVTTGVAVFSNEAAINCTEPCILVAKETTPDDIEGMNAAVGILTQTGGLTSHAAVVARGMNKVCVVGVTSMEVTGSMALWAAPDDNDHFNEGTKITIDGATGRVWVGTEVPVVQAGVSAEAKFITEKALHTQSFIARGTAPEEAFHNKLYVYSASFEGLTLTELREVMKDAMRLLRSEGVEVILDLTPKELALTPEDHQLEYMFQPPAQTVKLTDVKVRLLEQYANEWRGTVSLILDPSVDPVDVQILRKLKYRIIEKPENLKGFMDATGFVAVDGTLIETLFGGPAAYQQFSEIMAQAGKGVKPLPPARDLNEVLFEGLG